jgi:hypothetical protein
MLVVDVGPPGKPDLKQYQSYDGLGDLAFSPDGRRIGITANVGAQTKAVIDGKEGPLYDGAGPLLFTPDSQHVAYRAARQGQQFMVVDGKEGPPFDGIGLFGFSRVGGRFAYTALKDERRLLVVDHKPFAPAGLFAFSPDGQHLAHVIPAEPGTREKMTLAIDGVPCGVEYDGLPLGSGLTFDAPATARTIVVRGGALYRVELQVER